jgi:hypothetical protein
MESTMPKKPRRKKQKYYPITDRWKLHEAWLWGCLSATCPGLVMASPHPDLMREYNEGHWAVSCGYARVSPELNPPEFIRRMRADAKLRHEDLVASNPFKF